MDSVVRELPFMFVYLDDILVASRSRHEHRTHLQRVCQKLNENGLAINLIKCQFGRIPSTSSDIAATSIGQSYFLIM